MLCYICNQNSINKRLIYWENLKNKTEAFSLLKNSVKKAIKNYKLKRKLKSCSKSWLVQD